MPRRYRKKTFRRKRKFASKKKPILNALTISPTVRKFDYYDNLDLSPGVLGSTDANVYRANGMYDPDLTGIGSQPRGFDQWLGASGSTGFYQNYVVLGAKITAQFINLDSSNMQQIGIALRSDATIQSDAAGYIEMPNSRTVTQYLDRAGSGQAMKTLSMFFSAKKFFGVKNVNDGIAYSGNYNGVPTKQAFFHVWTDNPNGDDTGNLRIRIKIEYIAMLRDPVIPQAS